jgi:GNAT superfamily N-acetyltransferase
VSERFVIQPVRPKDVPAVVYMVHELAEYERAAAECRLTETDLHAALFAPTPALFGHVAHDADGNAVGAMLWFLNFSTWEGRHGIYLEDLYVRPRARGHGLGAKLLATLAELCVQRGYPRLEWWVLDWNPAREFYHRLGARAMSEWVPYRIEGEPLRSLATGELWREPDTSSSM